MLASPPRALVAERQRLTPVPQVLITELPAQERARSSPVRSSYRHHRRCCHAALLIYLATMSWILYSLFTKISFDPFALLTATPACIYHLVCPIHLGS